MKWVQTTRATTGATIGLIDTDRTLGKGATRVYLL
jgi:hypothetical protein